MHAVADGISHRHRLLADEFSSGRRTTGDRHRQHDQPTAKPEHPPAGRLAATPHRVNQLPDSLAPAHWHVLHAATSHDNLRFIGFLPASYPAGHDRPVQPVHPSLSVAAKSAHPRRSRGTGRGGETSARREKRRAAPTASSSPVAASRMPPPADRTRPPGNSL